MKQLLNKFHKWINGAPNEYITIALIGVGIISILTALFMPAEVKTILLAWELFP